MKKMSDSNKFQLKIYRLISIALALLNYKLKVSSVSKILLRGKGGVKIRNTNVFVNVRKSSLGKKNVASMRV